MNLQDHSQNICKILILNYSVYGQTYTSKFVAMTTRELGKKECYSVLRGMKNFEEHKNF